MIVRCCDCGMSSACQSDALAPLNGLRCLIQGALHNELKDSSTAEKVCD